jgi:oxalate decarboxylase/phosphoglucose isomerase-like protein (cupin superfamily)
MTLIISPASSSPSSYEYGCDLRRLYPWEGVSDPIFWGSAIASVRPGESTHPHSHDEEETFIIIFGHGQITVDGESSVLGVGDVIYLPRGSHHTMTNLSKAERLDFLSIFWGSPEAQARMKLEMNTPST